MSAQGLGAVPGRDAHGGGGAARGGRRRRSPLPPPPGILKKTVAEVERALRVNRRQGAADAGAAAANRKISEIAAAGDVSTDEAREINPLVPSTCWPRGADAQRRAHRVQPAAWWSLSPRSTSGRGMSFLDLIQEGNIGSSARSRSSTTARSFKFSTYAHVVDQAGHHPRHRRPGNGPSRIPVHMVETIKTAWSRSGPPVGAGAGPRATIEEIAEELDGPFQTEDERRQGRAAGGPRSSRSRSDPLSLETPSARRRTATWGDFIEDQDAPLPADAATNLVLREQLEDVLDTLTERERRGGSSSATVWRMATRAPWRKSARSSASPASASARSRPRPSRNSSTPAAAGG